MPKFLHYRDEAVQGEPQVFAEDEELLKTEFGEVLRQVFLIGEPVAKGDLMLLHIPDPCLLKCASSAFLDFRNSFSLFQAKHTGLTTSFR